MPPNSREKKSPPPPLKAASAEERRLLGHGQKLATNHVFSPLDRNIGNLALVAFEDG